MGGRNASVSSWNAIDDMYLSTLQTHIQALGGELKLIASFPSLTDV
jgi:hypothetical protein